MLLRGCDSHPAATWEVLAVVLSNGVQESIALAELQREIIACRACHEAGYWLDGPPLIRNGPLPAPIFVLGQAPALVHAQNPGIPPFSPGRHGQPSPLWKWLAQAGFPEAEFRHLAYMTAVTRCYPGPARNGSGDRRPSATEQGFCRPFWTRELALAQPAVMVTLGGLALEALGHGKRPLAEVIGQRLLHTLPSGQTVPLIPLPHPSGVSRWLNPPAHKAALESALNELAALRPLILARAARSA